MQDLKVGDLVEVLENKSFAFKNKFNLFEKGDRAIVKEVRKHVVRIGEYGVANLIGKSEIKKVEKTPELTEYKKELILRLAKSIELKNNYNMELENMKKQIRTYEEFHEKVSKEIKEITKKLLKNDNK